jgi:1-phosphofructokinase/6-phosphofructokinase 2
MIYTLNLNPAIDMNIVSADLIPNVTMRTRDMVLTPNGKGINVAFVLNKLGKNVGIIGFFGGFTGQYIVEECKRKGIITYSIEIQNQTRINVFLSIGNMEYKMVNEGPLISEEEKVGMIETLKSLTDINVLTINGSAARNIDFSFYQQIIELMQKRGIEIVLDISSIYLKELLKYKPLLIKPNDEELKNIFGITLFDEESAKSAMRLLHEQGAKNVLLTLGEKGAFFYNGIDFYQCGVKRVKQKSSLCAGDGFLAAFLSVWNENHDNVEEALKIAAATGADIAENDGIGQLKNVEKYKQNILVKKI